MCPCVYVCPYFPNRLGDEMSFSRIKSARMCGAIACAYYGCHVSYSEENNFSECLGPNKFGH